MSACQPACRLSARAPGPRADRRSPDSDAVRGGGAPGRRGGPRKSPALYRAAAKAANSRPWASGGRTRRERVMGRPRPLPRGSRVGLTPGSSSGRTGQSRAAQAWFFLSSQAGPGSSPARSTPLGQSRGAKRQGRPDSAPPPPGPRLRDWPPHWSAQRAKPPREEGSGDPAVQTGPGRCLRFRASSAVSRDWQFSASAAACQNSGNREEAHFVQF